MIYTLREAVTEALKEHCKEIYYYRAAKNANFPRCVFSIDTFDDEDIKRGTLTIDLYDNQDGTKRLEALNDKVRYALSKKLLFTEKLRCACYYDRTLILDDDDKKINRRQLQFELRIYEE